MSEDEVRSEEGVECQEVRASFPSFISIVDKKGSTDLMRTTESPDISVTGMNLYDSPHKSRASVTTLPDSTRKRESIRASPNGFTRRHAVSTFIGNTSITTPSRSPGPSKSLRDYFTSRSPSPSKQKLTERFLRLQNDMRRAGIEVEPQIFKYGSDIGYEGKDLSVLSRLDIDTIDKVTSPRQTAVRMESEEGETTLRPHLKWCPYCKREAVTVVEWTPTRKTWCDIVSLASTGICMAGGVLGCFLIPFFTKSCKSPEVRCSSCQHVLDNN